MLKIPETLKPRAGALVTKLKNALGEDLVSVTAYGRWLTTDKPRSMPTLMPRFFMPRIFGQLSRPLTDPC